MVLFEDVRFGLRRTAKDPGFPLTAVVALSLGIGANATVFAITNGVLFKNMPFVDDRILYAVIAHSVSQRTQEIGLRIALGASGPTILELVFSQGMTQAIIGLAIGSAAAIGLTRTLGSLLVKFSPGDPMTLIGVALVLTVAAVLGCLIPALRAMRVDPVVALRHE